MAKLCPNCQQKPQPAGTYRGSCTPKVSQNCKAWTDDFAFTICDPCAEELGRCAWCWGPLDGSMGRDAVPTSKQFCKQYSRDNGNHVTGMNVGEQILVEMQVDLYSGLIWKPKRLAPEVSYYGYRIVRDPQDWRSATIEMYFDLNRAAEKAEILLEEGVDTHNRWWVQPSGGKTNQWRITVEIKR